MLLSISLLLGRRPLERSTFRGDHRHQVIPGPNERLRGFVLELSYQRVNIDAHFTKLCQHFPRRHDHPREGRSNFAVENLQASSCFDWQS